jgi:hypothetical protein
MPASKNSVLYKNPIQRSPISEKNADIIDVKKYFCFINCSVHAFHIQRNILQMNIFKELVLWNLQQILTLLTSTCVIVFITISYPRLYNIASTTALFSL